MEGSEVREVSYEEALNDEGEGGGGAPTVTELPGKEPDQVEEDSDQHPRPRPRPQGDSESDRTPAADLEVLAPKTGAKKWAIGSETMTREYVQRELSVVGKVQWFSLVGEALDDMLSGDNRLSLNSLLTPPEIKPGQPVMQQFADADTFVHAVGKLLSLSPEFMTKSICIWLNVPDYEWDLVEQLMKMSPEDGGLSDDDFEEIVAVFLDQNYVAIERFFTERFPRLRNRLQARRKEIQSRSNSQKR